MVQMLRRKKLVVCPASAVCTVKYRNLGRHTVRHVYGLGGVSPHGGGLSVVYCSLDGVDRCTGMSGDAFGLVGHGLPKPFAFVLGAKGHLPGVFGGHGRMNVHMPSGGVVERVYRVLGTPVVAAALPLGSNRSVRCVAAPRLVRRGFNGRMRLVVSKKVKNVRPSAVIGYAGKRTRVMHRNGNVLGSFWSRLFCVLRVSGWDGFVVLLTSRADVRLAGTLRGLVSSNVRLKREMLKTLVVFVVKGFLMG